MNVTTNAIMVAMVMISVTKRVGVFTPRPGKNARQNFSFKGVKIFLYLYNDHKTIFAHNRGDMYCTKSHIHFQVSPSSSEIFNKNLKIGRFYPGLPWIQKYKTEQKKERNKQTKHPAQVLNINFTHNRQKQRYSLKYQHDGKEENIS